MRPGISTGITSPPTVPTAHRDPLMAGGVAGSFVGKPVRRLEDPRLVQGQGRFVDDLNPSGLAHVVFVRSPEAHALIRSIDISDALESPGVIGVFTAGDLDLDRPMPNLYPAPPIADSFQAQALASDEVCHVGEPIVAVVAESVRAAVDAAELVYVDLDALDPIVDHERALDDGAPLAHRGSTDNLVTRIKSGFGDAEAVFGSADTVVDISLRQHRGACASMEPRGVLARPDESTDEMLVWSSTQSPYPLRILLSEHLGIPQDDLRVVAPDVGGGFGPKAAIYAEEYVVTQLARRLGRPVKWIETRREHFQTTLQQRDQTHHLSAAVTSDGRIRGIRVRIVHDNGAYVPYGLILAMTGVQLFNGPYRFEALDLSMDVVYTNKPPTNPIRGAGRPYTVFALERLVDAVADGLGIDRVEIRRRNFIPASAFPYQPGILARDGNPVTYDSGDYERALDAALMESDADGFDVRRAESEGRSRLRGLGVVSYIEDTGLGPFEGARVEVLASGDVVVETGAASQGQGHATVFAQICADALGVRPEQVTVRSADTGRYGYGISTAASRTAVTAGSSVHLAATQVADMARELAAEQLEASQHDLVFESGKVMVVGQPGAEITLAALAKSMRGTAATPLPGGRELPGLAADVAFQLPGPAFAFGTHIAEVEVDPETGLIDVVTYTVAHDCGTVLNPMIVDGQIDGGVAHGLGNALSERLVFDEYGQPLTTTFMDYRLIAATEMPELRKVHTVTPSPFNPLGVKGAGEGGTLPVAAAVASAVDDALRGFDVFIDHHPLMTETIHQLIRGGRPITDN